MPVELPCGQCSGCRLEKSRQWALRCVHENSLHQHSYFLTLTYDEENLPMHGGLIKSDLTKFFKRYRQKLRRDHGPDKKIRYYACGEYGEQNLRPHYHAIIYGHEPCDRLVHGKTRDSHPLYTSDYVASLWPHGRHIIGSVTFESAAYVARYIMKKVNINDNTPENLRRTYERVNSETGEAFQVIPEYTVMSRRPGIGQGWYEKFGEETYRDDYIIQRGIKMQPPKYYDEQYQHIDKIKKTRRRKAISRREDNTPERLAVKEKHLAAQLRALKRSLSED